MTERVRFTIAVDQDVYDAFATMAHAAGQSLSRCIGDWLRDTAEAAEMTTVKLQEVRRLPGDAWQHLQATQEAFTRAQAEVMPLIQKRYQASAWPGAASTVRRGDGTSEPAELASRAIASARSARPPSSNTGGKSPGKTRSTR